MSWIVEEQQKLPSGTVIPKPKAKSDFTIKGCGKRAGQSALVYSIPNRRDPKKRYEKGITAAEWEQAHRQLICIGSVHEIMV